MTFPVIFIQVSWKFAQEVVERSKLLKERRSFDMDALPAVGPHRSDEQDRTFIDDQDPK